MSVEREELFKKWVGKYQGLMFKVVRVYAGTQHDREDLFQEILTQLWISIPRYGQKASESTWIYRVALNTAMVWNRGQKKRRRFKNQLIEIQEKSDTQDEPVDSIAGEQILEKLYEAINKLSKIDRSIVLMCLDGLSYLEMADVLGISQNNVGVKLNRAKKLLGEMLKEFNNDF